MTAFWDIERCFRGAYCLHHQGYEYTVCKKSAENIGISQTNGERGWLWGEKSVKKWAISWREWTTIRQREREVLGAWRERGREEFGPFQDHWSGQESTWSNQFLYFQLIFHAQLIYGPDGGSKKSVYFHKTIQKAVIYLLAAMRTWNLL
jgi:hypothetical protein